MTKTRFGKVCEKHPRLAGERYASNGDCLACHAAKERDRARRRSRPFRKEEIRNSTTIEDPLPSPATELKIPGPAHGLNIAVVTDTQIKHGVPTEHIVAAGKYIADKQPQVIVMIGDWWDMPSLSNWDAPGSMEKENRRYRTDIDTGRAAMEAFLEPIAKAKGYKPIKVFTKGNHEDRVERAIRANPNHLDGVISSKDFGLEGYGWKVIPYLQPIVIGGVAFCHYFPAGVMGKPISSARAILKKMHMSCFAGHQQGRDIAYERRADGNSLTAIISGSFYQHDENYLSPLANRHWRGMYFLHEVKDGQFDEMALSVGYLLRRFGGR